MRTSASESDRDPLHIPVPLVGTAPSTMLCHQVDPEGGGCDTVHLRATGRAPVRCRTLERGCYCWHCNEPALAYVHVRVDTVGAEIDPGSGTSDRGPSTYCRTVRISEIFLSAYYQHVLAAVKLKF